MIGVLVGFLWTMVLATVAYCWLDMVARVRSASYRKLAEKADKENVRWRFVLLILWIVAAFATTPLVLWG